MRTLILMTLCLLLIPIGASAASYELKHDAGTGGTWYGGDDREVGGPRHVGVGQSVLVDADIQLDNFSFWYRTRFDFAGSPTGMGHEVTLVLQIHDLQGNTLKTVETVVGDTFSSGWVTWLEIGLSVKKGTTLVFTSYLEGAYDVLQVKSSIATDYDGGYADGGRFSGSGVSDAEMEQWSNWSGPSSSIDLNFWLRGTTSVPVVPSAWSGVKARY